MLCALGCNCCKLQPASFTCVTLTAAVLRTRLQEVLLRTTAGVYWPVAGKALVLKALLQRTILGQCMHRRAASPTNLRQRDVRQSMWRSVLRTCASRCGGQRCASRDYSVWLQTQLLLIFSYNLNQACSAGKRPQPANEPVNAAGAELPGVAIGAAAGTICSPQSSFAAWLLGGAYNIHDHFPDAIMSERHACNKRTPGPTPSCMR